MIEVVTDDLSGEQLEGKVRPVEFSVDGATYRLDLGPESLKKFNDALAPFIGAADRVGKPARARTSSKSELADVRSWANANGFTVSARGRIPAEVTAAYKAAH